MTTPDSKHGEAGMAAWEQHRDNLAHLIQRAMDAPDYAERGKAAHIATSLMYSGFMLAASPAAPASDEGRIAALEEAAMLVENFKDEWDFTANVRDGKWAFLPTIANAIRALASTKEQGIEDMNYGTQADNLTTKEREQPTVRVNNLEAWIAAAYGGLGRAIRREQDEPYEGEPYMSMQDAKELTRRAVANFCPAPPASTPDAQKAAKGWQPIETALPVERIEGYQRSISLARHSNSAIPVLRDDLSRLLNENWHLHTKLSAAEYAAKFNYERWQQEIARSEPIPAPPPSSTEPGGASEKP